MTKNTETTGTKPRRSKADILVAKGNVLIPITLAKLQQVATLAKYQPTTEQKTKILSVIKAQVALIETAFNQKPEVKETGFTL